MIHDRLITISVGNSRKSIRWTPQSLMLSEFYEKLRIPNRSTESMQEFLELKKPEQDEKKDVGGFVAGILKGERRKAGAVISRDIITLDLDNIPPGGTDDVLKRIEGLGCGYCVYSTRKHSPSTPRLRVLLPLDKSLMVDAYEPVARYMAECIGIDFADPTTYDPSRLMYWPSCCKDSEYIYYFSDKPMLSSDGLLQTISNKKGDWKDISNWHSQDLRKLAVKQSDPLSKPGIVGAFNRSYDIYSAIDKFLKEVYSPVTDTRFTYIGGSTTGGAIIYDNGLFLYSYHSTDPCCGKLVNAFDLVRLHKFGDLDNDTALDTPTNRLPSYLKMCKFAIEDDKVSHQLAKERAESATTDFSSVTHSLDWTQDLILNKKTGEIKPTIDNIWKILENDSNLKSKFAINEFAGRGEILGDLPWDKFIKRRGWTDNDTQGLYWYLETVYGITGNGKIDGALSLHSEKHKFNDVKNYLRSVDWDGIPRLDTLLIDYLGAMDKPYIRAVTRKAFVAAVARAVQPGCKYDTMLILSGPQGIGKSTLLDKMSKGWFNDSIRTFEGKEASELLQGVWIVEIGELDAFRQTDVSRIKQFLSLRYDRFRAAYGRHVKDIPRSCVFFGTTNTDSYLRDRTGNRRFWPVDVGVSDITKSIWEDLDAELDQIWAEAVVRYKFGEPLYLTGELEQEAKLEQEAHREVSSKEGIIIDYVEKLVPEGWSDWPLDKRILYINGSIDSDIKLVPRKRICALEIWCEAFGGSAKNFKYLDALEINETLRHLKGWQKTKNGARFGYCGYQRGFIRKC